MTSGELKSFRFRTIYTVWQCHIIDNQTAQLNEGPLYVVGRPNRQVITGIYCFYENQTAQFNEGPV